MFIKVHDYENGDAYYINTNAVDSVTTGAEGTAIGIIGYDGIYRVKETADEIMKIIGYFKVANDK